MPVADFPGERNWGYDGVDLFAPARCYGTPDDLRAPGRRGPRPRPRRVLDVVYNHLGPDGDYLRRVQPATTSPAPPSHARGARRSTSTARTARWCATFFIENALHWVHEYHIDGLRLDATHAILDDGPRHFLAELAARVRASARRPARLLIAEDHRNLANMLGPKRRAAGASTPSGPTTSTTRCACRWPATARATTRDYSGRRRRPGRDDPRRAGSSRGQVPTYLGEPRGTRPGGHPAARGSSSASRTTTRSATAPSASGCTTRSIRRPTARRASLLLLAPETPLLFMGQEWAASTPFLYFTDHHAELGRLVTEGRRREFGALRRLRRPGARGRASPTRRPSATFLASQLDWSEIATRAARLDPAAVPERCWGCVAREPALMRAAWQRVEARPIDDIYSLYLRRTARGSDLLVVVRLRGAGRVTIPPPARGRRWRVRLSTEHRRFCSDPAPPETNLSRNPPTIRFFRPGAVILETVPDRVTA